MQKTRLPDNGQPIVIPDRVALKALRAFTDSDGGCHISTYSVASHGYAQIGWQEGLRHRMTTAHRAAWTALRGQIPLGMTVDHICRVRRCVNPFHLRLLSNEANARANSQAELWSAGYGPGGRLSTDVSP